MAKKLYFVGTDIGTMGTKSIIVDTDGKIISADYKGYGIITPEPLWAEQWPDVWLDGVISTIKGVLAKSKLRPEDIGGLTISGLYSGSGIPCDENMKALRPCLIWMDRRSDKQAQAVKATYGLDNVFEVSGNYVDSYHGFCKMLWIKENEPDIWAKAKYFPTAYGYCIHALTGSYSYDHCSAGDFGGVYHMKKREWNEDFMKELGIKRSFFPEKLSKSSDVAGYIDETGARLTGLLKGTPVCAGGVDCVVATLSVGGIGYGDHVAMIGTSMAWGFIHNGEKFTKQHMSMPHVINDLEMAYSCAGAATSGGIVKSFAEQFGQIERVAESLSGIDAYYMLDKQAERVPAGSDGLILLPYFMGDRAPTWNSNASGVLCGLTLYHTRAHIFRAILEGVAFSLRNCFEETKSLNLDLKNRLIIVGGVTKSPLWNQIFADVTGFDVYCAEGGGESAYGGAFLAALGTKAVKDVAEITKWAKFTEPVLTDAQAHKLYDRMFTVYRNLYKATAPIMDEIAEIRGASV